MMRVKLICEPLRKRDSGHGVSLHVAPPQPQNFLIEGDHRQTGARVLAMVKADHRPADCSTNSNR